MDKLTERITGCAFEVHRELGPGLLESIYESALCVELDWEKLRFQRQVALPVEYRGRPLGEHRLDLIVEEMVVVELKSVERFEPVFEAQLLTYLRLAKLRVGLLITLTLVCCVTESRGMFFDPTPLCVSVPLWLILLLLCSS